MSSPNDFTIENNILTKYTGPGGDVVIPPGVTAIGDQAFWDHRGEPITSITIPEGVTEIGHQALDGCTKITHVELPSSLRKIGSYTFSRWMSLRQITIPEGVEEIGHAAFNDCFGLSLIRLPASLKKIENVNIVFPDKRFILVDAPEGSYAEAVAKQNNMPLVTKEMTVTPDFVCLEDELIKYLGTGGEVTIPDGITYVGNTAFRFSAVTGVAIPDSVQRIGRLAFDSCRELTSVTIPEGVTEIRAKAFSDCYSLESVYLPATLRDIGDKAFHSFFPPDRITVRAPRGSYGEQYAKANGMQYLDSNAVPVGDFIIEDGVLVKYTGSGGEIVIPDGVTSIGLAAFARCENLTAVTVPEGVTEIREKAFAQCYGLRTIHLPASLTGIGEGAFESNLANAGFPLGSPTVTVRAPKGSDAEEYVKEGNMLFLDQDAVPTGELYLEGGRLLKYAGPGGAVTLPEGVTAIGYAAFAGCHALTSVMLPAGITELGWFAFADCENLMSVNLPEGLTAIGTGAFFGCGKLEGIEFPESLEVIEDNAFGRCERLEKIVLPDHLREIGQDAFLLCIGGSFIGKRELPDIYVSPNSEAAWAVKEAGLTFLPWPPGTEQAPEPVAFSAGTNRRPPDSVLWAISIGAGELNCSYLRFYCEEAQREEAAQCFETAFGGGDGDEYDKRGWCSTSLYNDGFVATFSTLYYIDGVGKLGVEGDPLGKAINSVKRSYPEICYQGVECFEFSNRWGGEMVYREHCRKAEIPPVNERLGKELSDALTSDDFWFELDERLYDEEDFAEVLAFFRVYADYIQEDTVENLLRMAEEKDPAIRDALEGEAF